DPLRKPPHPPALIRPPRSARALRVLVAEDNLVNQRVAAGLLRMRGHEVALVDNGRAALDALERREFDVVLMDVQMPIMDGLEATAAIRCKEARGSRRLPIVALTAHAMPGARDRFLDAGMDGCVSKPFLADELEAALAAFAP